ncbi:hypothetical protein LAZ67_1002944 [Cordylochernes scorpioides]|uniref:Uncharacterized protein n=1 Tax=Cordylochernes scorpioides TaxID=51811 RepID=A0ABY6JXK3_9ARAC|nr:hypothetical protein LAZ67_1002944 [Cordylochernes scorpioides]
MLVRTVELRTGKGLLRRPVNKVAVLPVQSDLTLTTGPAGNLCWDHESIVSDCIAVEKEDMVLDVRIHDQ